MRTLDTSGSHAAASGRPTGDPVGPWTSGDHTGHAGAHPRALGLTQLRSVVHRRLFGREPPPRVVGDYTVLTRIPGGGRSATYMAYDRVHDRQVALHVVPLTTDATADGRLQTKLRRLARLDDANVVTVYGVKVSNATLFLTRQWIEGPSIRRWIRVRARDWRQVLAAYVQAGRGLADAHARGIVHGGFSPDGVIVGARFRVYVVDFCLARRRPAYMSPEQCVGDRGDARSDQFSFCVALYEGLYGERPFAGETSLAPPPRGDIVPLRVRRLLLRGLSREPSDRFPSMEELLAALECARSPFWLGVTKWLVLLATATVVIVAAWFSAR